jgi:alpha-1,3-rhamnosyl/mannosyltransferase
MRLAFDARAVSDHFPGIGRYAFNLLRALAEAEPGCEVAALYNPASANTRFDWRSLGALPNVRPVPVAAGFFTLAEQARLPAVLRRLGADCYHAAYVGMPYRPGLPAAVTVHDLIPLRCPGDYPVRARLAYRAAVRLAVRAARRVVTVSAHSAGDLAAAYHLPPERLAHVPEAADPMFRPQPLGVVEALRRRLGLPERYVLYFGSNKPHKNLARLVQAYSLLGSDGHGAPLVVAGHWDARFEAPKRLAAAAGLGDRVRFLGPVAQADLPALYSGAMLFVYPSSYEGFGLPVLEAMACGAPVACANTTSLPEVAGQAVLYFDPGSPDAIAAALERALADTSLLNVLAMRSLERSNHFSWRTTAAAMWALYRDLAAETHG